MEHVLVISTAVDLLAVLVLGWLVARSARGRTDSFAEQRATLESLRGDLAQLVQDAEERARAVDEALGVRERRLRRLLAELGRHEERRTLRPEREADWRFERERESGLEPEAGSERGGRLDPAEARLLRDLDIRIGSGGRRA